MPSYVVSWEQDGCSHSDTVSGVSSREKAVEKKRMQLQRAIPRVRFSTVGKKRQFRQDEDIVVQIIFTDVEEL